MHSYVSDPIAWDACLIHAISIMAHLTVGWFEGWRGTRWHAKATTEFLRTILETLPSGGMVETTTTKSAAPKLGSSPCMPVPVQD
jgi:hypothetical protein